MSIINFRKRTIYISILLISFLLFPPSIFSSHLPWDQGHKASNPNPPDPPNPDDPPNDECKGTSSPCFVKSGNFVYSTTDLSIPSPDFPLNVSRSYNSHDKFSGPFGHGWVFNYGIRLYFTSDGADYNAIVRMPNGQRYKFKYLGGGAFQPPSSIWNTLFKNSDDTYTLTVKEGEPVYTFSADGCLTSIKNERGNGLDFTYDLSNQLEKVEDGFGKSIEFTFYPNGKINLILDHTERQLVYTYDSNGNLSSVKDPENRITTFKYESLNSGQEHFLTSIEDNWGRVITQIEYYPDRKVKSSTEKGETYAYVYPPSCQTSGTTTKTDLSGNSWSITFDEKGVITNTKDPYNKEKTFTYDADYNLIQIKDEEGVNTQYAYETGKFTQQTRAYGTSESVTWNYIYDDNFPEKIKKIQAPDNYESIEYEYYPPGGPSEGELYQTYRIQTNGNTKDLLSTYTYNEDGQITSVTNGLGKTTSCQYDTIGDLVSVTFPKNSDAGSNPIYSYIYDSLGRTTSITDPLGNTTSYTYDSLGRVSTITLPRPDSGFPEDFVVTYTYDNYEVVDGKILVYTTQEDPNSRVNKYYYDEFDQLVRVVDAKGKATRYEYERGKLIQVKDANLNATTYEYDKLERLVTVHHPLGQTTGYTYYDDSLLKTKTDRKGQTISYIYDELKRLKEKKYPDERKIVYTYTGEMLSNVQDQLANETINFNYDSSYRLSSISNPRGTISYTYTAGDQIQSYQVNLEHEVSYSYYDDGSIKSITRSSENPVTYYYTLNSQKERIIYPNDSLVDYSYDNQGRLLNIINSKPDSSKLSSYAYGYDYDNSTSSYTMKGFRTSMTNHISHTERYYFDELYQLAGIDYPNGDVHQWSYDDIGNRTQQIVTPYGQSPIVKDYTYYQNTQGKNSQLLQSDGIYSYTWDNNGNLLTKGSTNYTWDYDDRLVGINSATVIASYVYDYQGRRAKKTVSGAETAYLYNDEDIVKETKGGIDTNYFHGIGIDEPVMVDRAGAKYYYFRDGLGSIREMTDSGGIVQNSYNYGAWGEIRNQSGVVLNIYGYTGREFSEDGLYFYRARYLDSSLGRFISKDPFGGPNKYFYVGDNPLNFGDPLGLYTVYGNNLLDLCSQLRKYNGYAGNTKYNISYYYNTKPEAIEVFDKRCPDCKGYTGYAIPTPNTKITANPQIDVPIWVNFLVAAPIEQVIWFQFLSNLITHELGHVAKIHKFVQKYSQALRNIKIEQRGFCSPQAAKEYARRKFFSEAGWLIDGFKAVNDLAHYFYDFETGRGATQGAVAWWCF